MRIRTRDMYYSLKTHGMCVQCGIRMAVEGMTFCDPCAEHRADTFTKAYKLAKERGCCPRHRYVPSAPGRKQCQKCLDKDRLRIRNTSESRSPMQ